MKNSLLLFLIFPFLSIVQAQEINKLRISEFSLLAGESARKYNFLNIEDIRILAPQSLIANKDMSKFNSYYGYGSSNYPFYSAQIGILFNSPNENGVANPLLRLGISYFSGSSYNTFFYKNYGERIIDTFKSSQTGEMTFIKAERSESLSYTLYSEYLNLESSLIFRTNTNTRFSFYGGIGFSPGITFNNYSTVRYIERDWINSHNLDPNIRQLYPSYNMQEEEVFKNKNGFNLFASIPLGINFRLSKKNQLLKQINIYYEVKPGMNLSYIPEVGSNVAAGAQHGAGIRFAWIN